MNRLPAPVFFRSVSPSESRIHPHQQDGQLPEQGLLRRETIVARRRRELLHGLARVRVEGEAADDQHIEAVTLRRLLRRFADERRRDGPVFRPDTDRDLSGFARGIRVPAPPACPRAGSTTTPKRRPEVTSASAFSTTIR